MRKVLLIASDKGGVGKSTTAANLASMLTYYGKSVIILKTGRSYNLLDWSEKRKVKGLPQIPVYDVYGNAGREINRFSKLCDILIVDCSGHDKQEFRSALAVADIILTLVKPSSSFESLALISVSEKVRAAQKFNPELQSWVLFTRIKLNIPRHRHAVDALDRALRKNGILLQPLKGCLSELDVFESACNEGAGVHDVTRGSSLNNAKAQLERLGSELGVL